MLSREEVWETQTEQMRECERCARKPLNDFCPEVWCLGEVKMRLHECEDFVAKLPFLYYPMAALVCVKCRHPLPKDRYLYCDSCLREVAHERPFRKLRPDV